MSKEQDYILYGEIMGLQSLTTNEKFVLSEICRESNWEVGCYVTNKRIGERLFMSIKGVSNVIASLAKKGYLKIEIEYIPNHREIYRRFLALTLKTRKIRVKEQDVIQENHYENYCENNQENTLGGYPHFMDTYPQIMEGYPQNVDRVESAENSQEIKVLTQCEKNDNSLYRYISNSNNLNNKNNNIYINRNVNLENNVYMNKNIKNVCDFLNKDQYSRINRQTRKNIRSNFDHVSEEIFFSMYQRILEEERKGYVKNFNSAIYLALQGKWHFIQEEKIEKKQCEEEKVLWFKKCFAGIKISECIDDLAYISMDTLKSSRSRLRNMRPSQFKNEIKSLRRSAQMEN